MLTGIILLNILNITVLCVLYTYVNKIINNCPLESDLYLHPTPRSDHLLPDVVMVFIKVSISMGIVIYE